MGRYLVGITGASGSIYGLRTIKALLDAGQEVHAVVSHWGARVMAEETGREWPDWAHGLRLDRANIHDPDDLAAPPSSGSFRLDGTIIVPSSMGTIGAVASGMATTLIHRAAGVALKEGWPLMMVPREAPFSLIHLRNMTSLAEAGAIILPASPAFYQKPKSMEDLIDFMVGKILDRFGIPHSLYRAWGTKNAP
jgi:4-hydroxy-3-polyprenylbenzoate decarboxylase